jgi:hypothetical protein
MSHRLEYQWTAFHVPAASLGMTDDRFVIAIEGGDNNVCDARTGKRSRSWDVGMIGSRVQVLRQAVRWQAHAKAGACNRMGDAARRKPMCGASARCSMVRSVWRTATGELGFAWARTTPC